MGLGDWIGDLLGTNSQYEAQNPYDRSVLQNSVNTQNWITGSQQGLAQQLANQMGGVGPNPAQLQYQQNVQNNIANAQGMIASQRGLNPALATKMGINAASQANQQGAAQAGVMQAQQQLAAQEQLSGLFGQMQQGALGQQQVYNQAHSSAQGLNQNTASGNAANSTKLIGGMMQGAGAAMGMAHGGEVHGPRSSVGRYFKGGMAMRAGGSVPGHAKVSGDSYKNDTVNAKLSPGEIVIPRSVAQSKDAPNKAKAFVAAVLAKKRAGGK